MTVVATPLPGHGAEQKSGERHRAAGRRRRIAPRDENDIAKSRKNVPGARSLEHGAVEAEQHDVGDGDVERHAVDALERHVEIADQPRQVVAAMGDAGEADRRQPRSGDRVGEKHARRDRQNPAGRPARGFEHDDDREHAAEHVAAGRVRGRGTETARRWRAASRSAEQRGDDPERVDRGPQRPAVGFARKIAQTPMSSISGR